MTAETPQTRPGAAPAAPPSVRVWDLPVRVFHWSLVALVAFQWWSGEEGEMDWHTTGGLVVLGLLVFRLLWGFVGGRHARFADFVAGPRRILDYARRMRRGEAGFVPGHNPLGGWMILALLAVLLFQAGTGLFANDDIFTEGPLFHLVSKETSDTLTGLHEASFNLLLALVVVHVAAVIFYRVAKRENLVRAMITGRKPLPPGVTPPASDRGRPVAFVVTAALAALIVWALVTQL